MEGFIRLVVFTLDEQRYALRLSAVERIVCLVEVPLLPKAPEIVLGIVNVQGRVLPVVNIRRRFRLPEREAGLRDQLILALTSLQQRLVKTGGRLVKHARYYWLLLAEGHLTRQRFGSMLRMIAGLPLPNA